VTASDGHKRPRDLVADVFVYAPIGFASELIETFPKLVARGRERATMARLIGEVAMQKGRQRMGRIVQQVVDQGAPTPSSANVPNVALPDVDDADETYLDDTDPDTEQPIVVRHLRRTYDLDAAALLAIPDYDSLSASQVVPRLAGLTADELEAVRRYEAAHRARRTILGRVAQLQQSA